MLKICRSVLIHFVKMWWNPLFRKGARNGFYHYIYFLVVSLKREEKHNFSFWVITLTLVIIPSRSGLIKCRDFENVLCVDYRFGSRCFRIFRLLLLKKHMEQKQVSSKNSEFGKDLIQNSGRPTLMIHNYIFKAHETKSVKKILISQL